MIGKQIPVDQDFSESSRVMEDYQKEYWVSLYHSALIELEQAKISGRITAAQKSIAARVEKLRNIPGLCGIR
ncbi:MAG TPA: hypothetical protein VNZ03_32700 [Terriglobales bacterium]|jgi:hypothetical protein|nr:hypothetical protein [Terriglobales bacterium]